MSDESEPDSETTSDSREELGPASSTRPTSGRNRGSLWSKVFWLIVVLTAAAVIVFLGFVWLGKQGIDAAGNAVVGVAEAFRPEEVVQTFEEWRELEVTGTEGNILEVATAEADERFTRKTNVKMFGRTMPLGTTVSEIVVPATYRFHIDLDGEWFLTTDGSKLMVLAPRVRPSLPVAVDSLGVRKKSKSGWARWDGAENLATLEKTLTSKLEKRARAEAGEEDVEDEARLAVAKFVRRWLLARTAWEEGRFEEVVVKFSEEEGPPLTSMPPTLRLGGDEADEPVEEREIEEDETRP